MFRKSRKNHCRAEKIITNVNKIQDLEREKPKKGPEKSANVAKIAKVTRIFLASWKHLIIKYLKNSKNNNFHQILDLERKKAKKGLEKSANVAKIAKATRLFLAR